MFDKIARLQELHDEIEDVLMEREGGDLFGKLGDGSITVYFPSRLKREQYGRTGYVIELYSYTVVPDGRRYEWTDIDEAIRDLEAWLDAARKGTL